jgi:hypothetical protein
MSTYNKITTFSDKPEEEVDSASIVESISR